MYLSFDHASTIAISASRSIRARVLRPLTATFPSDVGLAAALLNLEDDGLPVQVLLLDIQVKPVEHVQLVGEAEPRLFKMVEQSKSQLSVYSFQKYSFVQRHWLELTVDCPIALEIFPQST